ncbi:MAG: calcium/sodium antiporter [Magnetospirillum sp. WYHS-4]
MTYLLLAVGSLLLVIGAEFLVRGGVSLAQRLGVTPLLIGLTVVAFGTSAPELFVSVDAALAGSSGIAVGNVVGSNIINVLLVLGMVGLVAPIPLARRTTLRDIGLALAASALFLVVGWTSDAIRWGQGLVMLGLLAVIGFHTYRQERLSDAEAKDLEAPYRSLGAILLAIAAGLGLLVGGARLLVESSIAIARDFGISEAVIGLTLVAGGTSLPELVTSVVAALRGRTDISVGNILGSNISNLLLILGTASQFGTLPVPPEIMGFDAWVMLAATAVLLPPTLLGGRLGRLWGLLFLAGYGAYLHALYLGQVSPS